MRHCATHNRYPSSSNWVPMAGGAATSARILSGFLRKPPAGTHGLPASWPACSNSRAASCCCWMAWMKSSTPKRAWRSWTTSSGSAATTRSCPSSSPRVSWAIRRSGCEIPTSITSSCRIWVLLRSPIFFSAGTKRPLTTRRRRRPNESACKRPFAIQSPLPCWPAIHSSSQ